MKGQEKAIEQNVTKRDIRACMLYEFKLGKNATITTQNICQAFGEDSVKVRNCQKWFKRFASGNMSLEDDPARNQSTSVNEDRLSSIIECNPYLTKHDVAKELGFSQATISRQLRAIGKVQRMGKWIPHLLSENQLMNRVTICESLASRNHSDPFLDRIVTGDEKWVLYINMKRRKQWVEKNETPDPIPKAELHPRKVMLSVWWNMRGIIHYEFLPTNETITGDSYAHQLERLNEKLIEKEPAVTHRKGVILLHDNAKPHTSKIVKQKIKELKWEVLSHPPYSPDLAPSDFHLFRSLQNYLSGKNFDTEENVQNGVNDYFASRTKEFYKRGIQKLPERWDKVVECNGKYIVD